MEWRQMDGETCAHIQMYTGVRPQKLLCPSRKSGHKTSTRSHDVFEYVLHSFLMKGTPTNSHDVFKYIVSFLTSRIDIRKIFGSISTCMIIIWKAAFDWARCSLSCFLLQLLHALMYIWDRGLSHLWQRFNQSALGKPWTVIWWVNCEKAYNKPMYHAYSQAPCHTEFIPLGQSQV